MHQNIQSLNSNNLLLQDFIKLDGNNNDIVILTETWGTNIALYAKLLGEDYNFIYQASMRQSGGIALYIRGILNFKTINVDYNKQEADIFVILVKSDKCNLILVSVYRNVRGDCSKFRRDLVRIILQVREKYNKIPILVIGDMNIDINKDSYQNKKYVLDIESIGLRQIIKEDTRITSTTSSLIDHIFIDDELKCNYTVDNIHIGIGDHNAQFLKINKFKFKNQKIKIIRRVYDSVSERNYVNEVAEQINKIEIENTGNYYNIEQLMSKIMEIVKIAVEKYFPMKEIKCNNKVIYFSKKLRTLRKAKDRYYKIWKNSKSLVDKLIYNKAKDEFKKELLKLETDYYSNKLKNKNINKKWEILNRITGKNNKSIKIIITDGNRKDLSDADAANHFNNYFISTGNTLQNTLHNYTVEDITYIPNTFKYIETTKNEIEKIILGFKEGKSINDGYSIKCIKLIAQYLSGILSKIINQSVISGIFPNCLKLSIITPVYKKTGDTHDVNNYRPIAITSIFHKIFEKVIYVRMTEFIDKFNVLSDNQYGFRKKHNTTHAITSFLNSVYNSDKGNHIVGIYLDIKKAYDSLSHEILLHKLEANGFRGIINEWLKSYITNRYQVVKVNGVLSNNLIVSKGVPQGSVLGCILFLVYINDLPKSFKDKEHIVMFADDTNILFEEREQIHLEQRLDSAMNRLDIWMKNNRLVINTTKTTYMMFNKVKSKSINLEIKNKYSINSTNTIKFLGVWIDNNLKFQYHINKIIGKLKRIISIIYKIRDKLDDKCKKLFYYSYIYAEIIYGIEIYSNTTWNNLKLLDKTHKRAIKTLFEIPTRTPTKEVYKSKNFLDLRHIIQWHLIKLGYEWYHNNVPSKVKGLFACQGQAYLTRQKGNIYRNTLKTKYGFKSIDYRVSDYWNKLPSDLRNKSYFTFKKEVMERMMRDIIGDNDTS